MNKEIHVTLRRKKWLSHKAAGGGREYSPENTGGGGGRNWPERYRKEILSLKKAERKQEK